MEQKLSISATACSTKPLLDLTDMKTDRTVKYLKERPGRDVSYQAEFFDDFEFYGEMEQSFYEISSLLSYKSRSASALVGVHTICASLVARLKTSALGAWLLENASNRGWSLSIADRGEYDFHLDIGQKHITLDNQGLCAESLARSDYFKNMLMVSLIRALRDIWHEERQVPFDERFNPQDIVLMERIRAADCDATTVTIAWELREAGHGDLWRHFLGSEEGDLAMAFSNTIEKLAGDEVKTYKAMRETFKQWFVSDERVNNCDHETLEYMDGVIAQHGLSNPFGNDTLESWDVEALGCLPAKMSYLQGMALELCSGAVYIDMRDEINGLHFSQIVYDCQVVKVQDVPFRCSVLAEKIFPNGQFTQD